MGKHDLSTATWTEIDAALKDPSRQVVGLLPIGSTEPHGPHLPLETDVIISLEAARRGAVRLAARGLAPLVFPPVAYSVTDFSCDFPGALGIRRETSTAMVGEICRAALAQGFDAVCLVNSHLEPDHLAALHDAAAKVSRETGRPVLFPDKTQRRWAVTLTEEFRSGACHAGRYESSLVMAVQPGDVRDEVRLSLPPVEISIGKKIKEGVKTFREAGGDQAYFGDPAAATGEEGDATYDLLATMIETAVLEGLEGPG